MRGWMFDVFSLKRNRESFVFFYALYNPAFCIDKEADQAYNVLHARNFIHQERTKMPETNKEKGKFYIVDEGILPEAILKTARIKELLAKYKDMTVNEAVEEVGLSRSAFYKYRDGVFPFYEATKAKIMTLQISMDNKAGILSNCINTIARANCNILTINQGIPVQNVAIATIAFETAHMEQDLETVIEIIEKLNGVLHVEIVGQS